MCIMCLEFMNQRMNFNEVKRALPELISTANTPEDAKHYSELRDMSEEELRNYVQEQNKKNK